MDIHVICLNVPYPPNYGGVIDIYYKIKALSEAGMRLHLHCFDYGRGHQPELEKIAASVSYYQRKTGIFQSLNSMPYIVQSRHDPKLLKNLEANDWPILFEGLHSTYYLNSPSLSQRIKIVRTHNIEHQYYQLLAEYEKSLLKKIYFKTEALKLKKYEAILSHATCIAAISPNDARYFASNYGKTLFLPPFHANSEVKCTIGSSNFALYHGDLSVRENIEAALFLVRTFKNESLNLVFAGRNPSKELFEAVKDKKQFMVIANPTPKQISNLMANAHIHMLPTFQPTGIKLKLINSLYEGRHCLVNPEMVNGTGLEQLCHIATSSEQFIEKVNKIKHLPFEDKDLVIRKEVLSKHFNNARNAELLVNELERLKQDRNK